MATFSVFYGLGKEGCLSLFRIDVPPVADDPDHQISVMEVVKKRISGRGISSKL
ncbi:hypothetical protein [Lacrimispora sp.]|uniref:hypothetical protein n=1 Tax=Lacrimispora sp. TaxID=2719234 RepID=UPI0028A6587B|nr:hypothetical protein [Lacrimispora sp.]